MNKKDRKHKRFCSKHQVVHCKETNYWSCRYPNDKDRNREQREWRANTISLDE